MKKILLSFLLIALLFVNSTGVIFAAEADVDTSFNIGTGFTKILPVDYLAQTITQTDGKMLIVGVFTHYDGTHSPGIVRINANGSVDTSFDIGAGPGLSGSIYSAALQADGKIIVGGQFETFDGEEYSNIVRLNANGSVDTSFQAGAMAASDDVSSIAVQSGDQKIIIAGTFSSYDGNSVSGIARLDADGAFDSSFETGDGFDDSVNKIRLQSDGKIIALGYFENYDGNSVPGIARISTNGSFDASFNIGSGPSVEAYDFAIQSDDKVIVGGNFSSFNGASINNIVRLNAADGSVDSAFTTGVGAGFDGEVAYVSVRPDGNIAVTGYFTQFDGNGASGVAVLDGVAGAWESGFTIAVPETAPYMIGTFLDNTMLLVGQDVGVIKLATNGSVDGGFDSGDGLYSMEKAAVDSIEVQQNGKILVAGDFQNFNGDSVLRLARLNANGTFDETFDVSSRFNDSVYELYSLPDNKILAAGKFTQYGGDSVVALARLNADGTLDETFGGGAGVDGSGSIYVNAIELQSDGKIVIGGRFDTYDGISVGRIARLNADGTIDTTFNSTQVGFDNIVSDIQVLSDDTIVAAGFFSTYNGSAANSLARLNADGSRDTTLVTGSGFNTNFASPVIQVQSDGKIVVAGDFTEYNTESAPLLARINVDGTLDTTFAIGTGFTGGGSSGGPQVVALQVQDDGKLYAGGIFTAYNGSAVNNLVRIGTDGAIDTSFDIGDGFDGSVNSITTQSDGKILVGGQYYQYDGVDSTSLVRLTGSYVEEPEPEPEPEPEAPRTRVVGGSSSSRPVVTTPIPSTDTTDCKAGDIFSATTGARCGGSTSPTTPTTPTTPSSITFTKVLNQGMTDPQVKLLQIYLNAHGAPVATTGAGSPGKETNFFGPATKAALIKFQELNAKDILIPLGLTKGTGTLAAKTIAFINSH